MQNHSRIRRRDSTETAGYDITFYTGLLHDPRQTRAVVDYVVSFIKKNPLTLGPFTVRQVGPQALLSGSYFAFLFVPASLPLPSDRDLDFIADHSCSVNAVVSRAGAFFRSLMTMPLAIRRL